MVTETGARLAQSIRRTAEEMRALCAGIDEDRASRAPEGRWTPKQILSHLIGPEPGAMLRLLDLYVQQDVPLLDLHAEQTYPTPERQAMSFAQLVRSFSEGYEAIARYAEGLTEEQFARTAHVPLLAQSPLGEYPTLAAFIGGLGQYHVQMHIEHLREILAATAAK